MKYIAMLLLALSLQGCFWQSVSPLDINKAIVYCGNIENVSQIDSFFDEEMLEAYMQTREVHVTDHHVNRKGEYQ